MILSKDNVAKNVGNTSPTIIAKIHNMPWLKKVTATKDSGCSKEADAKMFDPLSNLTENDQTTSEKKNKKRNGKNKNKKGSNADASKNSGNNAGRKTNTRKDEQFNPSAITQKNAWGGETNGAQVLFPDSGKDVNLGHLSEEQQLELALEISKETAMLEKFSMASPEDDTQLTDRSDSEEKDIWNGVNQNLPSPKNEESIKDFDTNNNADANKSQTSNMCTKKIESKVASSDGSKITKNEPANETEKIDIVPLNVPITPAIVPKFIDYFGRVDGCSEKRLFTGKGARMKEEQFLKQFQHQRASNGSQQKHYPGVVPPTSYPPRNTPAPMHDTAKGPNDRRNGPPPRPFSQDSQHPKNPHVTENNWHNEIQAGFKQSNDKNHQSLHPQDSQQSKNPQVAENNSHNGNQGGAKQSNDRNRQNFHSQDSQRPKNLYGAEVNSHNENQARGKQWNDKNRQSLPPQDFQHGRYPPYAGHDNARNDRFQRRSEMHAPPKQRPYQSVPYDSSKNPYKFQRDSNARNAAKNDKGDFQKSREVSHDEDVLPNTVTNRNNEEIKIPSLMATKNEHILIDVSDRTETEMREEAPKKMESNIHQEPQEFPENTKSHLRLSEFNSRHNMPSEHASLPIDPIPSCSSASPFVNVSSHSFDKNCDGPISHDACQTKEFQIPSVLFTVPPPGFEVSGSVRHASQTATYVVPVESSLSCSSSAKTVQTSVESPHACKPEIDRVIPIPKADLYARLKLTDPMLYELLIQKEELDVLRKKSDEPIVSDVPKVQNSSQGCHSLYDLPTAQQHCHENELLNPNAKQFMPNSEQAWAALNQPDPMACYSRAANYDLPSIPHQHQYTGPPEEVPSQDNPIWNPPCSKMYYNTEQSSQQQHVNANVNEATPTAILGRQNNLVSEKNYPSRNAQSAMHMPQLNDDYPRCQTSGFENIPMVLQRQVPSYRASLPQCGVAPNHFCSMHCAASYGSQNQASTNKCACCFHPVKPLPQQYLDFFSILQNMRQGNIVAHQVNDDQHLPISTQDCQKYENNSIMQSEYVVPTIGNGLKNENHQSLGRGKTKNRNSKK